MQVVYLRSKHVAGKFVAEACPTYTVDDFGNLVQIAAPKMIQGYGDAAYTQPVELDVYWFAARNEPGIHIYYS